MKHKDYEINPNQTNDFNYDQDIYSRLQFLFSKMGKVECQGRI